MLSFFSIKRTFVFVNGSVFMGLFLTFFCLFMVMSVWVLKIDVISFRPDNFVFKGFYVEIFGVKLWLPGFTFPLWIPLMIFIHLSLVGFIFLLVLANFPTPSHLSTFFVCWLFVYAVLSAVFFVGLIRSGGYLVEYSGPGVLLLFVGVATFLLGFNCMVHSSVSDSVF